MSALFVGVFGGLTIIFDNKVFFYMKPTIINLIFAVILIVGKIFEKSFLKLMLESNITLADEGWNILTNRWIIFFIFLALLNELVWRVFGEDLWVKFKVFGILPITFVFLILQVKLIQKFKID